MQRAASGEAFGEAASRAENQGNQEPAGVTPEAGATCTSALSRSGSGLRSSKVLMKLGAQRTAVSLASSTVLVQQHRYTVRAS